MFERAAVYQATDFNIWQVLSCSNVAPPNVFFDEIVGFETGSRIYTLNSGVSYDQEFIF